MSKPNVLLILSDQQRYDTIHAAGYEQMITPSLDWLTKAGTMYENAHSSNPVCMPARHDLMTGFPAKVHGYFANADNQSIRDYAVPTLARIFSEHDYRTTAIGKMHFSPTREHHGFGELHLMEELPQARQDDQYACWLTEQALGEVQNLHGVRPYLYHIPQTAQTDGAHHGTTWVADRSIEWLKQNEEHPFFMMCGFIQPHPPWNIPTEWENLYKDKKIPASIPISRLPFEMQERGDWFGDDDTAEQKEKIRKAYYTAVSMVDHSVGRILDYLRDAGKLDNTLVIFTSDHGEMLQDKGYYSKELPYDSAVRIPMIVKYPNGERAGERNSGFADLLDILPTCLDVCGLTYPQTGLELYGKSLCKKEERIYQFSATGKLPIRWVMCRTHRYKYIYHFISGYEELYDMQENETCNLLAVEQSQEITLIHRQLKEQSITYEEQWGVEGSVQEGEFVACPMQILHPSVRGKYHFWANHQTQEFYEKGVYDRGKRLQKEMAQALSNAGKGEIYGQELFDDTEWQADFAAGYEDYTGEKVARK